MNKLNFYKLWKYGVLSGIVIGLISNIPIIGGWDEYARQFQAGRYSLHPGLRLMLSLFFWVIGGLFMCWLISKFAFSDKMNNKGFKKIKIFIAGGLVTAIAIQLAARDALIFNINLMNNHKGGPLGQPSFETIGNFFASGFIYVGIFILFLNCNKLKSFFKTNYLSTLFLAIMSYGAVAILWYIWHNSHGERNLFEDYIFTGDFPHLERIFLLPLIISVLFIIYYFGIRHETKKMNEMEFDVAISFSYADIEFANNLRDKLKEIGIKVYKDDAYEHELIGKILMRYFNDVFRNRARYGIVIISKNYITSLNATMELAFIQDIWLTNRDFIIPIKIDDTKLSELDLPDGLGYLDARRYSINEIAEIIKRKIKSDENTVV